LSPICRIPRAIEFVAKKCVTLFQALEIALATLWKKLDNHEKPFSSMAGHIPG
jgi:hypothetical protein